MSGKLEVTQDPFEDISTTDVDSEIEFCDQSSGHHVVSPPKLKRTYSTIDGKYPVSSPIAIPTKKAPKAPKKALKKETKLFSKMLALLNGMNKRCIASRESAMNEFASTSFFGEAVLASFDLSMLLMHGYDSVEDLKEKAEGEILETAFKKEIEKLTARRFAIDIAPSLLDRQLYQLCFKLWCESKESNLKKQMLMFF